jgi:hypothetical protein
MSRRTQTKGTDAHTADKTRVFRQGRAMYGGLPRPMLTCRCSSCGLEDTRPIKQEMPVEAMARFFRARGWIVDAAGKVATCPRCQEGPKVTADFSRETLKRQRQMYGLLDEQFDEATGRYREGWSDERIAKDCGISANAVAKHRDAAYGPIRADPALEALQRELVAARTQADKDMAELRGLLDHAQETLQGRIEALQTRLEALLGKAGERGAA